MKKITLIAGVFAMALTLLSAGESKAFFNTDVDVETDISVETNTEISNEDSAVAQGFGNTSVNDIENSVVIGDDAVTRQSNFVGAIGINRGDLSQSNSANITGNQETNIHNNDMRSIRGRGNNR